MASIHDECSAARNIGRNEFALAANRVPTLSQRRPLLLFKSISFA